MITIQPIDMGSLLVAIRVVKSDGVKRYRKMEIDTQGI